MISTTNLPSDDKVKLMLCVASRCACSVKKVYLAKQTGTYLLQTNALILERWNRSLGHPGVVQVARWLRHPMAVSRHAL